ncbi:MAG: hypothetical protein WHT46_03420 [Candidatus Geothermincolales bacterium]
MPLGPGRCGVNRCRELRGCPASQYLACEAWREGSNCWEVEDPRCSVGLEKCMRYGCPVYSLYSKEIEEELKRRALRD